MTADDIKYLADTIMIENGFYPAQIPYASVNQDQLVLGYSCNRCKSPGAVLMISGIHMLNTQDMLAMSEFINTRCCEAIFRHDC
jgi:hypothetical protein